MATNTAPKQAPLPVPANQQSPGGSRLGAVKKGRLAVPSRYFVYGPEGTGKTTLLSYAPDPIWMDADDGTARLDVARYQFRDAADGHVPHHYAEILAGIDDLTRSPHGYKTLVLDTVDRVEALLWRHVIDRDNERKRGDKMESIEDYGYGKGFNVAVDEWRRLCVLLDRLRTTRGMHVAFVGHSFVKSFKNPEGPDYDRYQPAINEKAAAFLRGWSDVVGFLRFEEVVTEEKRQRPKGVSTGQRIMHLARSAAFDAKGRGGMPAMLEIPLENPWAVVEAAETTAAATKPEDLVAQIEAELIRIGSEELAEKVRKATDEAAKKTDLAALGRYLLALKDRPVATTQTT